MHDRIWLREIQNYLLGFTLVTDSGDRSVETAWREIL